MLSDLPFKNTVLKIKMSSRLEDWIWLKMVRNFESDLFPSTARFEGGAGGGLKEEVDERFPCRGLKRVEIWVDSVEKKQRLSSILRNVAVRRLPSTVVEGRLRRIAINVLQ